MEKFLDAEQLFFWWVRTSEWQAQNPLARRGTGTRRPCELADIEIVMTQLCMSGKLDIKDIHVLAKWGKRHTAPHPYRAEHDAKVWDKAMKTLGAAFRNKGWTEQ